MARRKKSKWEVQSILFNKLCYSARKAKNWAKRHGFDFDDIDTAKRGTRRNYHRIRQESPSKFSEFRTISFGSNGCIKAVIGKKKK